MKKDLDTLLKQALTPSKEPDPRLNEKILRQVKETKTMDMKKTRRIPAAAFAAVLVLGAGSVTAYASWKYLAPEKITENLNDTKLTGAFQGKDAVSINERQTLGGYHVTLLGIVSGKDISQYKQTHNGIVMDDRTYCVTAIENADGTPMPDTSEDAYSELSFFVSPLIKGYNPVEYNAVTMRGGYSEFVEDGILYRLTECDNVEIFADHGLYLCVSDSTFYNNQAYHYDKETGLISRNEEYDGLNALFELPVDVSKADPEAAAKYLTSLQDDDAAEDSHTTGPEQNESEQNESEQNESEQNESEQNESEQNESEQNDSEQNDSEQNDSEQNESEQKGEEQILKNSKEQEELEMVQAWMEQITPENIDEYGTCVESTVQTLTPDSEGYLNFEYEVEGRCSAMGSILLSEYFKDQTPGMCRKFDYCYSGNGLKGLVFKAFTMNEDGTVTFAAYIPKED